MPFYYNAITQAEDDPPGVGSSYMWNLRIGDELKTVGPLGDFRARDSGCDMIVIGGGAGMAPLRSIIRYELAYRKSGRNIQYWYGARSKRDLLYVEELEEQQAKYSNFRWHAVLSESNVTDDWNGATGFVHTAVRDALSTSIASHNDVEY